MAGESRTIKVDGRVAQSVWARPGSGSGLGLGFGLCFGSALEPATVGSSAAAAAADRHSSDGEKIVKRASRALQASQVGDDETLMLFSQLALVLWFIVYRVAASMAGAYAAAAVECNINKPKRPNDNNNNNNDGRADGASNLICAVRHRQRQQQQQQRMKTKKKKSICWAGCMAARGGQVYLFTLDSDGFHRWRVASARMIRLFAAQATPLAHYLNPARLGARSQSRAQIYMRRFISTLELNCNRRARLGGGV